MGKKFAVGKKAAVNQVALIKRSIDLTRRLITQLKRYLVDLQVESIFFLRGYKQSGLQLGSANFFPRKD